MAFNHVGNCSCPIGCCDCGYEHGRFIKNGRVIDVGIDAHDLKLVSEDRIIEIINDPRDFIESSLTEFYKTRKDDKNDY